ncbi:S1 RNA-binding domain-containing protein [Intestinimonas timonensis]|uniref:S1 RNA-binding domain-containing protein n=1 Tax=Intestinimonas timonensis TaxID=1689270 RepID=UPI001F5E8AEE|nr:S1 RNA-binding domain-containing protein [Intestinimonas timonensis]
MLSRFLPEGRRLETPENQAACSSLSGLLSARDRDQILEGMALSCSPEHDLTVALGPFIGVIPRLETAVGVAEGTVRDIAILSRVGKPVCFLVEGVMEGPEGPRLLLSRRRAQSLAREALMARLRPGMVIPCTVTHLEPFGAFVDMGCGLVSMIGLEQISVSRIPHPACRFTVGQEIFAAVVDTDPTLGRVRLTHRELLGTWEENARRLTPGMTVAGWVRGIKDYGAFVELFPNLSGLAEPREDLHEGDRVSVFLKSILPERMKIKLLIIDRLSPEPTPPPLTYFITDGRLGHWRYAPEGCRKTGLETDFL